MRYAISCEEITEEQADDLINPVKEGVTAIKAPLPLSGLASELLSSLQSVQPKQIEIREWAVDTGYALPDARKAATELVRRHEAAKDGSKYSVLI